MAQMIDLSMCSLLTLRIGMDRGIPKLVADKFMSSHLTTQPEYHAIFHYRNIVYCLKIIGTHFLGYQEQIKSDGVSLFCLFLLMLLMLFLFTTTYCWLFFFTRVVIKYHTFSQ